MKNFQTRENTTGWNWGEGGNCPVSICCDASDFGFIFYYVIFL